MPSCRIHPASSLPDPEIIERFRALSCSLVSDVFDRWSGAGGILPIAGHRSGEVVVGSALTVRTRPGDNLAVHKALDIGRPGETLVVAAGGDLDRAIIGGLMGHYAQKQQLAALVIDGAVRDRSDLDEGAPPVFARGLCQLGPYKDGPGDLRCPVSVGGLVVEDGDLVLADEDGITAVPRNRMEEILIAAEAKAVDEAEQFRAIAENRWDRSWVDASLDIVELS